MLPIPLSAPGLLLWHNVEYILYNMVEVVGLPPRDVAYLNKDGDFADERFKAPKNWFSPERRAFSFGPDGYLKEDDNEDRPSSFAINFAERYAYYYKKKV